jgi:hypothetical protein
MYILKIIIICVKLNDVDDTKVSTNSTNKKLSLQHMGIQRTMYYRTLCTKDPQCLSYDSHVDGLPVVIPIHPFGESAPTMVVDPFKDLSSIAHQVDFSHEHALHSKVRNLFPTPVNSISATCGFSLVVSSRHATFDLSIISVSLIYACLGVAYDE